MKFRGYITEGIGKKPMVKTNWFGSYSEAKEAAEKLRYKMYNNNFEGFVLVYNEDEIRKYNDLIGDSDVVMSDKMAGLNE